MSETPRTPFDDLLKGVDDIPEFIGGLVAMAATTTPEAAERIARWLSLVPQDMLQVSAMPVIAVLKERGGPEMTEKEAAELRRLLDWFFETIERVHILCGVTLGELRASFPEGASTPAFERVPNSEFSQHLKKAREEGREHRERNANNPSKKFPDDSLN